MRRPGEGERVRQRGSGCRRAAWQVPVVLASVVGVWAFLSTFAVRHGYFDLSVYYGAIRYWASGHDIYGYVRPHAEYGFTYPPFAALVMLPMAVLPWRVAIAINVTLTVLASAAVLHWLVDPIARRQGWTRWFALAIAAVLAAAFEPMRETVNFGQVNMVLVVLVLADLLLLVAPARRLAGIGIGLATAIKLTPGIFVLYLLVTRRWRAAGVAVLTASAATLVAALIAPDESRVFWTDAVFNTDRVGARSYISNQSLQGAVSRLYLDQPWSSALWLGLAAAVLAVWWRRARAAARAGDELTGFTVTALVACLVSPFTWVHHLVWIMPAFALLVEAALASPGRRRRIGLLVLALAAYGVLCSRLVWPFDGDQSLWVQPLADAYMLVCLAFLVFLPARRREGAARDRYLEPGGGSTPAGSGTTDGGGVRPLPATGAR